MSSAATVAGLIVLVVGLAAALVGVAVTRRGREVDVGAQPPMRVGETIGPPTVDGVEAPSRHPAAEARELRHTVASMRKVLASAAAASDEALVSSATALVDHVAAQVARELAVTPIGSLRSLTSVTGVRLSVIGSAGYVNVAQVLAAGSTRLQQIPGIGPVSATQLLTAAGEVREAAFRRARLGFLESEPSSEQDEALRAIWRLGSIRARLHTSPAELVDQARQLRRLRRSLWLPGRRLVWLVALPGRRRQWRQRVAAADGELREREHSVEIRQATEVLRVERAVPPTEELWAWANGDPDAARAALEVCAQAIFDPATSQDLLSRPRPRIARRSLPDAIAVRLAQTPRPRAGHHGVPAAASGVDDTTALYRLFDASGRLLYVGISNNVHTRIRTHRVDKHWGPLIADARIEWFPTRATALAAEVRAIRRERPRHNVMHNG